jgi:hypothetical protein
MNYIPDFSEVAGRIPANIYSVKVVAFESHHAKNGTQCVRWRLVILDGDFVDRTLFLTTPLSGKGACFLRLFLRCINPAYDDGQFSAQDFIEKQLFVRVIAKNANSSGWSYMKVVPLNNLSPESIQSKGSQNSTELRQSEVMSFDSFSVSELNSKSLAGGAK